MKETENALQCPDMCQRLREILNLNQHNVLLSMLPEHCVFGDSRLQWMLLAGEAAKPEQPGSAQLRVLTHPGDDLQKNSDSNTTVVTLPAQTHNSPVCAMKNVKLFSQGIWAWMRQSSAYLEI